MMQGRSILYIHVMYIPLRTIKTTKAVASGDVGQRRPAFDALGQHVYILLHLPQPNPHTHKKQVDG